MTEQEKKEIMLNLADTLKGEINRMCVTKDLSELDSIKLFTKVHIRKLYFMRLKDLRSEGGEDGEALHT